MQKTLQKTFPAMGTVHTFTLFGEGYEKVAGKMKAAVLSMDRAWSVFRADSELSFLNRSSGIEPVLVRKDTFSLLQKSVDLCSLTDGAFDICSGALSALWRKSSSKGRLPSKAEVDAAMQCTNARTILLNETEGAVFLPRKGQTADFGGIAKGFASDLLKEILKAEGVENALLNLGGTVTAVGAPVSIGIRNPFDPKGSPLGRLILTDQSAVTSGSYERFYTIRGRKYHHIIDPRTGYPAESGLVSVTLVGTNATELDALATAVFVLGAEKSLPLLRERGIGAIFILESGEVLITEPLRSTFSLNPEFTSQQRSKKE